MRVAVLVTALLMTVAGCGADTSDGGQQPNPFGAEPPTSDVRVDTPALRELKAEAGIEDCPSTRPATAVAGGLPDVTLPCLGGGEPVHLSDLIGRPLVVNLWASWCPPCREELPLLQEYAESAEGRVDVIGVDFNDVRPEAALELARRSGVTYPLVADLDSELRAPMRVVGMPMTYLVDADGRVVRTLTGQIHSVAELDRAVADALGVRVRG